MAPEQIRSAKAACPASDVWSMGVVWFQALSGVLPHQTDADASPFQLMTAIVNNPPRSLRQLAPHVDPGLTSVIDLALARDPASRFATMRAFSAAIADPRALVPSPTRATPKIPSTARPVAATVALPRGALPSAAPAPKTRAGSRTLAVLVGVGAGALVVLTVVIGLLAFLTRGTPPPPPPVSASAGGPSRCDRRIADPTGTPINVRSEPDPRAASLARLPNGTPVELAEERNRWARVTAPVAGWVWSAYLRPCDGGGDPGHPEVAAVPTCPATRVGGPSSLAQLASGMDIRWGQTREAVEARCGRTSEVPRSACVAEHVDTRLVAGPTGIGQSGIKLSYAMNGDGLFEVGSLTQTPREELVAAITRRLGRPDHDDHRVTRWDLGEERLTISSVRGQTMVRAFHRARQQRYAAAVRVCSAR